jgi:hypothetical protein
LRTAGLTLAAVLRAVTGLRLAAALRLAAVLGAVPTLDASAMIQLLDSEFTGVLPPVRSENTEKN